MLRQILNLKAPNAKMDRNVFPQGEESETASDSPLNRSRFIQLTLNIALGIVDANAGSLFLWDEYRKEMILEAANGHNWEQMKRPCVKLGEGVMGWVMRQGNPVLVQDIRSDERFHSFERIGRYRSYSLMCVPLVSGNKLVGVMNVTERGNLKNFDEEDMARIEKFTRLIAADIENLRSDSCPDYFPKKDDKRNIEMESPAEKTSGEQNYSCAVEKLTVNLAHELNNPLDAVRRYVNLALDRTWEDSFSQEYLLKAQKGIIRIARIMADLLAFSKQSSEDAAKIVDLRALMEQSLDILQDDEAFQKIAVQKIFCEGGPIYVKDHGLSIVLRNLYKNARQAMKGEGTLTVSIWNQNGNVGVAVQDTGNGVEDVIKGRIFEPFFSTKDRSEGTGIGLALCREIVERCGGTLMCENSHKQPGARFIFTLPRKEPSGSEISQKKNNLIAKQRRNAYGNIYQFLTKIIRFFRKNK
ncbi:MAG: GAF domain-containing sensor histidine kinase [Candidatus Omnitrophica bacterium]|nr:GAF domain-containing sensor histidine kinase [Candidatus Omnitrophota bacterium]